MGYFLTFEFDIWQRSCPAVLGILLMSQAGLFRSVKVKAKLLDYVMLDYFRLEDVKMNPKVLP